MTQYDKVTIDPTVTNGSQLAANINSWRKAALTLHSGVERPSYASAGTMWISTASSPWKLCVYDGTDDVVIGELKPDSHDFVSAGGTDYTNDLMTADNAAEAREKLGAVSKSGDRLNGELRSHSSTNFRMRGSVRAAFWHINSDDLYLMLTNANDLDGSWNNLRPFRVHLSDGYVTFDHGLRSNSNINVGGATVHTDGNVSGSIWSNWGSQYAYSAISNRIEDRAAAHANNKAPKGGRVRHDSGVYEIGNVDPNYTNVTVDCPGDMFVTGLRTRTGGWQVYVRAKYARNY